MSKTKNYLENLSEHLGFGGEINDVVTSKAESILYDRDDSTGFCNVHNKKKGITKTYMLPPVRAIICAYAQEKRDYDMWNYATKGYHKKIEETESSYYLGNWRVKKQ